MVPLWPLTKIIKCKLEEVRDVQDCLLLTHHNEEIYTTFNIQNYIIIIDPLVLSFIDNFFYTI